ncbi:hypothetical protein H8356DRAFT_1699923 [Neocallimastix lanati (nom. inval.)]|nr:hypothetical protein H8356DRAFT_1699923 [Neocallimastix sp. JGI-2020a]
MSMINDIEGKLKELSHRIKAKQQQQSVTLTPQQKNLLKLKKIWHYIDTHHGPEFKDVYVSNTSLTYCVRNMLNLLEGEERQIMSMSNPVSPVSPIAFQGISHSNQAGILMEFMLDNAIFISFVDAALEDQPFGFLQVVIRSFSHLCGELNAAFLTRHSVQRALNKLIYVTATTPKLNELYENSLIELIFVLCQKMQENPTLINFFIFPKKNPDPKLIDSIPSQKVSSYFFSSSTSNDSCLSPYSLKSPYHVSSIFEKDYPPSEQNYEFFIFNYLMNYYFRAGNQGDYALTAISILLDLDFDLLYKYLLNNDFPLVVTASLCGSYNALPTNKDSGYLELNDDQNDILNFNTSKEFEEALKVKIDKEKELFEVKNEIYRGYIISDELNIFLRIFQFIQKITTDCKYPKIVDLFLYYFNELFIKNVLKKQLFNSKKIEEEDYSRIFYLKFIFNNLQSPVLSQLFYKNLFPEVICKNDTEYLKKIATISNQYRNAMIELDKVNEKTDENENENENEEDKSEGKKEILPRRRRRLLSIALNERLENQLAIIREIEQTVTDENYYKEKFKSIYEIDPKVPLHYARESSLSKFSTEQINLAAIHQINDSSNESKNLYSYILSRLNSQHQGLRLVTLQFLSTVLSKQNVVATHKLFPCYFVSSRKANNNDSTSIDVSLDTEDIHVKAVEEDTSLERRKELEMEYLKLFHCIHHFKKLFDLNMNCVSYHLVTNSKVGLDKLQFNRYLHLFKTLELPNINSKLFIYPYVLEASSSIQYNRYVDSTYDSILANSSLQQQPSTDDTSVDVSSYINIPSDSELKEVNSDDDDNDNNDDSNTNILSKLLSKEKMEDILSIMKGFHTNQLLQCLLNYLRNWLNNPYEINIALSGVFHQIFTSADHLFLGQYLIMGDQFLPKGENNATTTLYSVLEELIQKINKNYHIIKTSTKIHLFYLSMYEKLREVQENINLRGKSMYISLESAVDVAIICDYNDFLNAPTEGEGAKEFEGLLKTLTTESDRQDLLNMFKLSTIKNIIILLEFMKDILASLHVQYEQIALS